MVPPHPCPFGHRALERGDPTGCLRQYLTSRSIWSYTTTFFRMPISRNIDAQDLARQRQLLDRLETYLIDFVNELPALPDTTVDEDDRIRMQNISFEIITFINNMLFE